MILADLGAAAVVLAAIVAAVASVVVGYWNTHQARSEAEQAKEHTVHASQKAAYAATVSLATRAKVDEQLVPGDVVEQFEHTIAIMAAAQTQLQRETNEALTDCQRESARLVESNALLTLAVEEQRAQIGALRDELAQVRGRFEDFLVESRRHEEGQ